MYLSIGQTAELMGVSISTLRRWEKENYWLPCYRTKGNHRRYSLERIEQDFLKKIPPKNHDKKIITYSRVSSYDQKEDLKRQEERLIHYCRENNLSFEMISDLGSGINTNKKGLKKLIRLIVSNEVAQIILTHKDRLLRFGSPLIFKLCDYFNTKVIILDDKKALSFEEELVADVIEIMTVFTAKIYGKRAHSNKQRLKTT